MEARSAPQYSNSTWRLLASIFELLLSAIFLLQLAVVFLTFQLIKFLGQELPCWNSAYCYHRSVSCSSTAANSTSSNFNHDPEVERSIHLNATSSNFNHDPEVESSSSGSAKGEGSFRPLSRQDTSAFDKFFCPKCKCLWTSSQSPPFKDANDPETNEDDASSCNYGGIRTSHTHFRVGETSARRILLKCRSMQEGKVNNVSDERWSRKNETRILSNETCLSDTRTDHLQVEQQVKEISSRIVEEVMESQVLMGKMSRWAEVEADDCPVLKEPTDVIKCLRDALQKEHDNFCALYAELEEERSSAETAANEAMAMISRLQEEKAALHMEAAQYQRMVEEKAAYDDQTMTMMKEILYRKERDNFLMEREMKLMKSSYAKEMKRVRKRRKGTEQALLFPKDEDSSFLLGSDKGPLLLLQGVNKTSEVKEGIQERCTPCTLGITKVQPYKRFKSTESHHGNENSTFVWESPSSQSWPDVLSSNSKFCALKHKVDHEASVSGEVSSLTPSKEIQQKGKVLDFAIYKDDFGSILSCLEALQLHLKRHTKISGLKHGSPVHQLRHSYSMPSVVSFDRPSQGARGASYSDCLLPNSLRVASLESEGTLTSAGASPRPALAHLNCNTVSHDFAACSPNVQKDTVIQYQPKKQVFASTLGGICDCHSDGNPPAGIELDAHRQSLQVQLFNMERDSRYGTSSCEVARNESEALGSLSPLFSSNIL